MHGVINLVQCKHMHAETKCRNCTSYSYIVLSILQAVTISATHMTTPILCSFSQLYTKLPLSLHKQCQAGGHQISLSLQNYQNLITDTGESIGETMEAVIYIHACMGPIFFFYPMYASRACKCLLAALHACTDKYSDCRMAHLEPGYSNSCTIIL